MGKSSSDEGAKAAKAGLCACGICCALCIGIPLLIIIIIIIIIVVVVASAADDVNTSLDDAFNPCKRTEKAGGSCDTSFDCRGSRMCVNSSCTGEHGC